jgi:hypothetical protein
MLMTLGVIVCVFGSRRRTPAVNGWCFQASTMPTTLRSCPDCSDAARQAIGQGMNGVQRSKKRNA